jgi:hypothetical protein
VRGVCSWTYGLPFELGQRCQALSQTALAVSFGLRSGDDRLADHDGCGKQAERCQLGGGGDDAASGPAPPPSPREDVPRTARRAESASRWVATRPARWAARRRSGGTDGRPGRVARAAERIRSSASARARWMWMRLFTRVIPFAGRGGGWQSRRGACGTPRPWAEPYVGRPSPDARRIGRGIRPAGKLADPGKRIRPAQRAVLADALIAAGRGGRRTSVRGCPADGGARLLGNAGHVDSGSGSGRTTTVSATATISSAGMSARRACSRIASGLLAW